MKLHQNQLDLILHLIRFNIMSYEDCLKFLDTEHTGDLVAMSYIFRPLTKNKYVAKNKDGRYRTWQPDPRCALCPETSNSPRRT